jgi:methionyl-tRNA formyltransferase
MQLSILTNNNSWFKKFGKKLQFQLRDLGHSVSLINKMEDIINGEICFILSYSKILDKSSLNKNKNNIVVHASDLPSGKGFSPMQWTILNGKNEIVLTLFEATEALDAGPFYFKDSVVFNGYELYEEMREIIGNTIVEMCIRYIQYRESLIAKKQKGIESYFKKRTIANDEINPSKSILEQFNHFRIADNENFPLYFFNNGKKYYIKIFRDQSNE